MYKANSPCILFKICNFLFLKHKKREHLSVGQMRLLAINGIKKTAKNIKISYSCLMHTLGCLAVEVSFIIDFNVVLKQRVSEKIDLNHTSKVHNDNSNNLNWSDIFILLGVNYCHVGFIINKFKVSNLYFSIQIKYQISKNERKLPG